MLSRAGKELWRCDLVRDEAFRVVREATRRYAYDRLGRLCEARDGDRAWQYRYDAMDGIAPAANEDVACDGAGRAQLVRRGPTELVFRHNQAGEMLEALVDGARVARCLYDHKGRLVLKTGPRARALYLWCRRRVAGGGGRRRTAAHDFLRLPTGIVGMVDFRFRPEGGSSACTMTPMEI